MGKKTCSKCEVAKPLAAFWRKTSSPDGLQGRCITCMSTYAAARYLEDIENRSTKARAYEETNRERIYAKNRQYYEQNKGRISAQRQISRAENREAISARYKVWVAENADRLRECWRSYRSTHRVQIAKQRKRYSQAYYVAVKAADPSYFARKSSDRRALILQAKPAWADDARIAEFYKTAHEVGMLTGEWYHVDHIVPLRGKTVCGLHTDANLRVMQGMENIRKSNKHWPDQP